MTSPSSLDVRLERGPYTADIASVGASLRTLRYDGRDVVAPFEADEIRPVYTGAVLAPWPNRVGDGSWMRDGITHQLPINEPDRQCALHGLVNWLDWSVRTGTEDSVTLACEVIPQPGYPFRLALEFSWFLGTAGLRGELVATNSSDEPAPYGCGIHPYLVAPRGGLDDWTVTIPAALRQEVDERLLPLGEPGPPPDDADFSAGRRVGDVVVDHAYSGVRFADDGSATASVLDADGRGSAIRWDTGMPWVHVCTGDRPEPRLHRRGLAVEPTTCPPNALVSGRDLIMLASGASHTAWWEIAAIG